MQAFDSYMGEAIFAGIDHARAKADGEYAVHTSLLRDTAKMLEEKKISKEDNGSVIVDFEGLVPGKEGKRLGKTVIR